mmetsp:Transcript_60582/g.169779  ORF Transcript_60582/g.169779 Transcript_60582/m.169779 type:complete len:273 (-) Transcript_60582:288-1106(-)
MPDVLPMHLQVWAMAVVLLDGVGALLLMVHADGVAELVDDVADVPLVAAPAEVDGDVLRAPGVTNVCREAVILLHLVVGHDDRGRGRRARCLDELDARGLPPCVHGFPEGCAPDVVDLRQEEELDDGILLPSALDACDERAPALLPRAAAWAAILRPTSAVPRRLAPYVAAFDAAVRGLGFRRQQAPVLHGLRVFLGLGVDRVPRHDGVDVRLIPNRGVGQLEGHATVLEVAHVAEDLQGARAVGRLGLQLPRRHTQPGRGRLLLPDRRVER